MVGFADMEWRIEGYESTTKIFECAIPLASLSAEGLTRMLELLVARKLQPEELVSAALGRSKLLEVTSDSGGGKRVTYWCGGNPHYVAGLFRKDE